jgi:hypothetical protein
MSNGHAGRRSGAAARLERDVGMQTCAACGGNVLMLPAPESSDREAKCIQCGRTAYSSSQSVSGEARYDRRDRKAG